MAVNRMLTQAMRNYIFKRDSYGCVYCCGTAVEIDHVVPWAHISSDNEYNLVASCKTCNRIASDHVFDDIEAKRKYILEKRDEKGLLFPGDDQKIPNCSGCGKKLNVTKNTTSVLCDRCTRREYGKRRRYY